MSLVRLIWKNITGSKFRSAIIIVCAVLVAALAVSSTLIIRGVNQALEDSLERMGADITIIPWGTRTYNLRGARLMSLTTEYWIPRVYVERVAAVEGVQAVTPQQYMGSLHDFPEPSLSEVYLVAYDPYTDFSLAPWVDQVGKAVPAIDEAMVGSELYVSGYTRTIQAFGRDLTVVGAFKSTGSEVDRAIFITFDTAKIIMASTWAKENADFEMMPDTVSSIMVKAGHGVDSHELAYEIMEQVPGVRPIENMNLLLEERTHMVGLIRNMLITLGLIWILSVVFMGVIFTIVANERRRQIGVLRALGSPVRLVLRSLLTEGTLLSLSGGILGVFLSILVVYLWNDQLAATSGLPILITGVDETAGLGLVSLLVVIASVLLAMLLPVLKVIRMDPAQAMRE